jgi:hypothetical protein
MCSGRRHHSRLFTGLQWWEAHTQLLLAVKPSVDFYTANDPDSPPVGIAISNAGPGPAIVKSVTFYVDRKSVRDAEEAGITYANLSQAELDYYELEPEDTLAVVLKLAFEEISLADQAQQRTRSLARAQPQCCLGMLDCEIMLTGPEP